MDSVYFYHCFHITLNHGQNQRQRIDSIVFHTKNDGIVEISFNSSFSRYIGWNGVNTHLFKVREQKNSYQNFSRLKE
jgi:hypothetical protein